MKEEGEEKGNRGKRGERVRGGENEAEVEVERKEIGVTERGIERAGGEGRVKRKCKRK